MNGFKFFLIIGAVLTVSGCNSTGGQNTRPQALVSVPTEPVIVGDLQPANSINPEIQTPSGQVLGPDGQPVAIDPQPGNQQVANLTPPANGGPKITREGMAGSWNVPSDNGQCRIILAFTKWSGGYRAATRRCNSPEIATITAWDVKGQRVVLVDNTGNMVASLYASGGNRYDGTTNSGKPITFSR